MSPSSVILQEEEKKNEEIAKDEKIVVHKNPRVDRAPRARPYQLSNGSHMHGNFVVRIRALSVLSVLALVSACGGGSGSDGDASLTPPPSTQPPPGNNDLDPPDDSGDDNGDDNGTGTGNGNGNGNDDETPPGDDDNPGEPPPPVADAPTPEQAALFLTRATFGPTRESIDELVEIGYSAWIQQQLEVPVNYYGEAGRLQPVADDIVALSTAPLFWEQAIAGPDQLRQRAAFALSQIFVISAFESESMWRYGHTIARYMDILQDGAFGNYRDLLENVTYSPAMGTYLTYLGNSPADAATGVVPDENYAREIMQLFTIGLLELNRDGTPRLDRSGQPIETYDNDDITELAKVFTGLWWSGLTFRGWERPNSTQQAQPMAINERYHSNEAKSFLGITIPANTPGAQSIDLALDRLFEHDNLAPFVCRQLIQRFVTSNPSRNYVLRVVNAFESGEFTLPNGDTVGQGRRGDLAATVAAILLDPEALDPASAESETFGKIREPVIRFTHWARAVGVERANPGRFWILENTSTPDRLNQQAFRAPSVFNFFRPGYVAPGSNTAAAGLVAPELQITDASSAAGYVNFMQLFITHANASTNPFEPQYDDEIALIASREQFADHLDLVLMSGRMRVETRARLLSAIEAVSGGTADTRSLRQVQAALMVAVTSSEYLVQR